MARIGRTDHARILELIDGEGRKVVDVAAQYGCTPANIYVICSRLRRSAPAPSAELPVAATPASPDRHKPDLFATPATPAPPPVPSPMPSPMPSSVTELPRHPPDRVGIGARLAKPGYGLAMRTADGEESLAPFASLDDLLTAIKPILRASARSPDPVWFSIRPIDLAAVETDAA